MTKNEAIELAEKASARAADAFRRYYMLASVLGSDDPLVRDTLAEQKRHEEARRFWRWFASVHHTERSRWIREGRLTGELFA